MGLYSHKTWIAHDKITDALLNTIEDGIDAILNPAYVVDQGGAKGTHATIQGAIDAAELNGGGDVHILNNGTNYSVGAKLVIDNDNVNLIGVGHPTLFLANSVNDELLEINNADWVTIKGIIFDGNRANQSGGRPIYIIGGSEHVSVENCLIKSGFASGIEISNGKYCFIGPNNTITDGRAYGIRIGNTGTPGQGSYNTILGNYLYDNSQFGSIYPEIRIESSSYVKVGCNTIDCNSSSTYCVGEAGTGDYSIVMGNIALNAVTAQFNAVYTNSTFQHNEI